MTKEDFARKIIEVIDAYGENNLDMIATIEEMCKQQAELEIEQAELDIEIRRYLREVYDRDTTVSDVARHFAKWQRQQDNNDANHALVEQTKTQQMCYEKGMADMKQQLMANAVEVEICDHGCAKGLQFIPVWPFTNEYLDGEKVKVIIIRE